MAEKILVLHQDEDPKFITFLAGHTEEETIYAVTKWIDGCGEEKEENVELAVHVDDMIKIRDFCNKLISKIGPAGKYTSDNIFIKREAE